MKKMRGKLAFQVTKIMYLMQLKYGSSNKWYMKQISKYKNKPMNISMRIYYKSTIQISNERTD